jgi:maltooligosyltrehalose trehalohydrolase
MSREGRLGAIPLGGDRASFRLWAPFCGEVEVELGGRRARLRRDVEGYHHGVVDGVPLGARYLYRLDGKAARPDPASRSQPEGVHGPSELVATPPRPIAPFSGVARRELVIYELHIGTFTDEGTFEAAARHLGELRALGVTAVELMPIAEFPGGRNWGYDGVGLFAPQSSYGGPAGLATFVDRCHREGLGVILDVVYNHLGPEGNYLGELGPYFTDAYHTPWGAALNFDGPESDHVRRFFIEDALLWVDDYRIDGLRLDAVHAIFDRSSTPFLEELAGAVHRRAEARGRRVHLIAETDANDPRLVRPTELGGLGLEAMWCDDLHHALHASLTGERIGYYRDYGSPRTLALALGRGAVFMGERSSYRHRPHGRPFDGVHADQLVVCAQNHDQVGNRMLGERFGALLDHEGRKLAAAAVILSPYLPLLFMGEEHGETNPFLYFVSHGDPALVEAVREGRAREFHRFEWKGEPPDPQAEETFLRSKLDRRHARRPEGEALLRFYTELLALRRSLGVAGCRAEALALEATDGVLLTVHAPERPVHVILHLGDEDATLTLPLPAGRYEVVVDSADGAWLGPGSAAPKSFPSKGEVRMHLRPRHAVVIHDSGRRPADRG